MSLNNNNCTPIDIQLHYERTEERRKLLQAKQGGGAAASAGNVSDRWKKLAGQRNLQHQGLAGLQEDQHG